MYTFKQFFYEDVNEGLGDLLGDIWAGTKEKVSTKVQSKIPQGAKDIASRLFNIENVIVKLLNNKQYKELGQLLIEKKIPQNFVFKRITLFRKNRTFGAPEKKYTNIPLFFAITAIIVDSNLSASIGKIFANIESAGIDITTYLNRLDSNNRDIISFIMTTIQKPLISPDPKKPSVYEVTCSDVVKALLLFGHTPSISNNLAVHTSIRYGSLPIFRSFIESKYPIKMSAEIQRTVDTVNNLNINKFLGMATAKSTKKGLDFSRYGYNIKDKNQQILTLTDGIGLLVELSKLAKKPIDLTNAQKNYTNETKLKNALIAFMTVLKYPTNITIV